MESMVRSQVVKTRGRSIGAMSSNHEEQDRQKWN